MYKMKEKTPRTDTASLPPGIFLKAFVASAVDRAKFTGEFYSVTGKFYPRTTIKQMSSKVIVLMASGKPSF